MRFVRWLPTILLVLLVALPAFPPLINAALQEGIKAVGFEGSWNSVSGYLLTGIEMRGAHLKGNGLEVNADRVWVGYNLVALLRKELPLRIRAYSGTAKVGWDAIIPTEAKPAAPRPFQIRIDELLVDDVAVELANSPKFPLPTMKATLRGDGPDYGVDLALPGGNIAAKVRRTGREFEAWEVDAVGDLTAGQYWYKDFKGGQLEGHWVVGPKAGKNGIVGHNQIKNATVSIVGFTVTKVNGLLEFDGKTVTANLTGQGLGAPVRGFATVDIPAREYRFRVEGNPTLTALAQTYKLGSLPVQGSGPMVLEGHGWEKITLTGRFGGQGKFINEPLTYNGTLGFANNVFSLGATANSSIFDRTLQGRVDARTVGGLLNYTVNLTDIFGSRLRLDGRGANTVGRGTVVLPKPLIGDAKVDFFSEGPRWTAKVDSKNVQLAAAKPFDLSGNLQGQGDKVLGQLGAVRLSGGWSNLAMDLSKLELVVGEVGGKAALKNGRFSADLNYTSPYTRFPVAVRQVGNIWRLGNQWANGSYANNVFDLSIRALPLQVGEALELSGNLKLAKNKLSGGWTLTSEHSRVQGQLYDLATRYSGTVFTPLGNLPLMGTANQEGLFAKLKTLEISATGKEGLRLLGPLDLGLVKLQSDLGLRGNRWVGQADFKTQWFSGTLRGEGENLVADAKGYAQLSGPVWPTTALTGRLTLPLKGFVEVPQIPISADRASVHWDGGAVQLKAGLPFSGTLPLLLDGKKATLKAQGDIQKGSLELISALGTAKGQGEWRNLAVTANGQYAGYEGAFKGTLDLFKAGYAGRLEVPKLAGYGDLKGRQTQFDYAINLQQGRLLANGSYGFKAGKTLEELLGGLRLQAQANNYDLNGFGLPAKLTGSWSNAGGKLRLDTQYGPLSAYGTRLLGPLSLQADSQYAKINGLVGLETVNLNAKLNIPYLEGDLKVVGTPKALAANGSGRYKLPYLAEQPWKLSGNLYDQNWKLEGPLKLQGQGSKYTGTLGWPYSYQGRSAVLSGSLSGNSLNIAAALATNFDGLPLAAKLSAQGADLDKLKAQISLPDGRIQVAKRAASFDLEAAPIAKVFKADVSGRLKGQLDLQANGEVLGDVLVSGQKVELTYRNRSASVSLPAYNAGVTFGLEAEPTLVGTGGLSGKLKLGQQLSGDLAYTLSGNKIAAKVSGTRETPQATFLVSGSWGKADGQVSYEMAKGLGSATLNLQSPYAKGQFEVASKGTQYQATGQLQSLQYFKQNGALKVSGEGSQWSLSWFAPMKLEASGSGSNLTKLRAVGQGELEISNRRFALDGEMRWADEKFAGAMTAKGEQVALELSGQGSQVLAKGTAFEALVNATVNRQGELGGTLRYSRKLYTNQLEASAKISGTVFKPVVLGNGVLTGKGENITLSFGFQDQPWADATAKGLEANYRDGKLAVEADRNLQPFVGYDVNLKTKGTGTLDALELPLELTGQLGGGQYRASGTVQPLKLTAQLSGDYTYPGYKAQSFDLNYNKELLANLKGPYASGKLSLNPSEGLKPLGLLTLDLPVPGGRAVGTADLGKGFVQLEGREGWEGSLTANLRQGWNNLNQWNIASNLRGKAGGQGFQINAKAQLDTAPLAFRGSGSVARLKLNADGSFGAKDLELSFDGAMALAQDRFAGTIDVQGPQTSLRLLGQGKTVAIQGSTYGAEVKATLDPQGNLGGGVSYATELFTNHLGATAKLSGSIAKPVVEGLGELTGKGDAIKLRFGYSEGLWAEANAKGLEASLKGSQVQIDIDRSLEAFVGYSVILKTSGSGTLDNLDLPVDLSGDLAGGSYHAVGRVQPLKLTAGLEGAYRYPGYEPQRFTAKYDQKLRATLSGPYATGNLQLSTEGSLQPVGLITLDLPVPGGRAVGTADLALGTVRLEGREGWEGSLTANLRQGWKYPALWNLQSDLRGKIGGQELSLKSSVELDGSPLALRGSGVLGITDWGQVGLTGEGSSIALRGQDQLAALTGRVQLSPLKANWNYSGPLPRNLGSLEAHGSYPGQWASGTFQYPNLGPKLSLEGRDQTLSLEGPGIAATITSQQAIANLDGFAVGPAKLSGTVKGPFANLNGRLGWEAYGRKGTIEASYQDSKFQADLSGEIKGTVAYSKAWSGQLTAKEGSLKLSGNGIPQLEGALLGFGVRLNYPQLVVAESQQALSEPITVSSRQSNLSLDIGNREAQGELRVRGVAVAGKGQSLEASYPLAGGSLIANLDLQTFAATLSAPSLGSGALSYEKGLLGGELNLNAYGVAVQLKGVGDHVQIEASHQDSEWLPWKGGKLEGLLGMDGAWKAHYADIDNQQQFDLVGKLADATFGASGQWAKGTLGYNGKWQGQLSINYPLDPLSSKVSLEVIGNQTLSAKGQIQGDLGKVEVDANLDQNKIKATAGFSNLLLQEVPLLSARLPFLQGRTNGTVELDEGALKFVVSSPALKIKGDALELATRISGAMDGGVLNASLVIERPRNPQSIAAQEESAAPDLSSNRTIASLKLEKGILKGEASAAAFPLHWLLSAWNGDLQGEAFWTGKAGFSLNTRDIWASKGTFVGEKLRFRGGGDELTGSSVLRFEQQKLYIDQLALSGKGTWKGKGYWGRDQSDFELDLENTTFTPVLQVIPQLRPYTPEGSGTLRVSSNGQAFDFSAENFKFRLGPVRAETPKVRVRVAENAVAEGHLTLSAPYPAEADLSGEGNLENFTVKAKGTANVPLLSPNEPFDLSFTYPSYVLDGNLEQQNARLYGTLFPQMVLSLTGQVPVRYPSYYLLDGLINSNLILVYEKGYYTIRGSADVIKTRLGFPEGQNEVSIPASNQTSNTTTKDSTAPPVRFDNVRLLAEKGILINEALAQGELKGDLYINGDFSNPFLSGEVVPIRGSFKLWDRDFIVRDRSTTERSYASFSPSSGILPELQIVADTQVQDRTLDDTGKPYNQVVQINLTLKGRFARQNGKIKINLEPTFAVKTRTGEVANKANGQPYTDAEVYALLLLGRTELSAALPADIAQTGIQAVIQNFIVGQFERELAKTLGLDQVKVEIPALAGGQLEQTRFTIGRYLSSELYLAYAVDLRGYQSIYAEFQKDDYRFTSTSSFSPNLRQDFSFGYSLRTLGADLTFDFAAGDLSNTLDTTGRTDGVKLGFGINFRF